MPHDTLKELKARIVELEGQLQEAQETLDAIRSGRVESLVIEGPNGPSIFSLEGATYSYRVLVEAINDGAITMGDDGVVLYCNPRFAQMVGAPLENVMGNRLREWIPERLWPMLEELLRLAVDGDGRGELSLRTADGAEARIHLSVSVVYDEGRRVYCMVATALATQVGAGAIAG